MSRALNVENMGYLIFKNGTSLGLGERQNKCFLLSQSPT